MIKNQTLEQKSVEEIAECKWCGQEYNLKERQEQVKKDRITRGITAPSHAAECCTNRCWIEADNAYCF